MLFLCVIFGLVGHIFAGNLVTLADLRRACENQAVLTTHPFYPDSVWNSWINEGCCDQSGYGIIEKLDTIMWISGVMVYDLNVDFVKFIAMFPLVPTDKTLLNFIPARDVGKVLEGLLEGPRNFWQSGKGKSAVVGFFPVPEMVDTLLVIYGAEANYMDSNNDTTEIPYSYRPLIIDYVVYRALLRDGKKNVSDRYWESYMERLEIKLRFDQKIFDVLILPKEIKE